jgi:hypothetical protein
VYGIVTMIYGYFFKHLLSDFFINWWLCSGDNVPAPFMTFDQTGFPPELLREVKLFTMLMLLIAS